MTVISSSGFLNISDNQQYNAYTLFNLMVRGLQNKFYAHTHTHAYTHTHTQARCFLQHRRAKQEKRRETQFTQVILQFPQPPCQEDSYGVMHCHLPSLLCITGTCLLKLHHQLVQLWAERSQPARGLRGLEVHFCSSVRADRIPCAEKNS